MMLKGALIAAAGAVAVCASAVSSPAVPKAQAQWGMQYDKLTPQAKCKKANKYVACTDKRRGKTPRKKPANVFLKFDSFRKGE